MVTNTAPAQTASLAHSIGSRAGTTASEARIMPVLYSPVITRTPRTPMDSCAKKVPVRLVEIAVWPGSRPLGLAGLDAREEGAESDHEDDSEQQRVERRAE